MENLSREEHKKRHLDLHNSLGELIADWIGQTEGRPSKSTVLELIKWSYQQTINPTDSKDL